MCIAVNMKNSKCPKFDSTSIYYIALNTDIL